MPALFNPYSLSNLYVFDCPELEKPPIIYCFQCLVSIAVINSTVVSWREAGELSDACFVDRSFSFDVPFVDDPVGFAALNKPVAPSIEWISVLNVDGDRVLSRVGDRVLSRVGDRVLSRVGDRVLSRVGDHLHSLLGFGCDYGGLTAFPCGMYDIPLL